MLLPLVLVIRIALFPDMTPIHFARFESEKECAAAAADLDQTTRVRLVLSCEIDT